jgi:prepilin-type N-terminal cleavage/methylation domain-containing protein
MHHLPVQRRTASSRGGFTLVELLVVIGIIAILAGVALGPITNGIKKAQQSAGVQSAHAVGLALYSCANDNQQLYPDTSNPAGNTGTAAAASARALLAGGYVTDPSIFWISSDSDSGASKFTGALASAASTIASTNISWDFVGNGGPGVSSVNYPSLPVLWSTIDGAAVTGLGSGANTAITAPLTAGSNYPFGTVGLAVFFENNASQFVTANPAGTVTFVTANNNSGAPSAAAVLSGN